MAGTVARGIAESMNECLPDDLRFAVETESQHACGHDSIALEGERRKQGAWLRSLYSTPTFATPARLWY